MARIAASLTIALVLVGCVDSSDQAEEPGSQPPPDEGGGGTGGAEDGGGTGGGVAERGERGGPQDPEDDGDPVLEIGGVRTEATDNDTVELSTREAVPEQSAGEPGSGQVDWVPRLTLTFTSAERDGDDVTFHGRGEYLLDDGGYTLHSKDFTVLVPNGKAADEVDGFDGQYDEYVSDDDEELVTLTADEPDHEFAVTIADIPPEDEEQRHEGGITGSYVQYETPEELWGHEVQPEEYVPGRLCFVEGDEWHDVELFEQSDLPCG